jgi:hypothetical protein
MGSSSQQLPTCYTLWTAEPPHALWLHHESLVLNLPINNKFLRKCTDYNLTMTLQSINNKIRLIPFLHSTYAAFMTCKTTTLGKV